MAESRRMAVVRGGEPRDDDVVVEEPLEIRVEEHVLAITLRTPGHDRELAAGFLYTSGVVERPDDLVALEALAGDPHGNTMIARVSGGVEAHAEEVRLATRTFFATSACGVCGAAALPRLAAGSPPLRAFVPDDALLSRLSGVLDDGLFARTHGAHAAALVSRTGEVWAVRSDVGRHNAVDKVLGWAFLAGRTPVEHAILVVSGRAGFELVHKARVAGVPALVAVGAASSLAVDLARDAGLALVGFLRPTSWTRYAPLP